MLPRAATLPCIDSLVFNYQVLGRDTNGNVTVEWLYGEDQRCNEVLQLKGYTLNDGEVVFTGKVHEVNVAEVEYIPSDTLTTSDGDPVYYTLAEVNRSHNSSERVSPHFIYYRFDGKFIYPF